MKHPAIQKIRQAAEKDLRISDCAMRLLFRVLSDRYCDPHHAADEPFLLPWTQIAYWCGMADPHHCNAVAESLADAGYFFDEGLRGCPPMKCYKLNLKFQPWLMLKKGIIPPTIKRQKPAKPLPDYVVKGLAALRAVVK